MTKPNKPKLTNRRIIIVTLLLLAVVLTVKANITTSNNFNVIFPANTGFQVQDSVSGVIISFQAKTTDWNASCSLAQTDDSGGTLIVTPTTTGNLLVTANYANVSIKINGVEPIGMYPYLSGSTFTIVWNILSSSGTPRLPTLHVSDLWQYLLQGDLLGFFQAIFMVGFNSADLLYGVLAMVFCIPLYIRTKSLLFLCIIWVILGGFFIALMPIVSGLALLFMALGIGGLIFKLIRSRST